MEKGPLAALKQHLGLLGRADFRTDRMGADLVWDDERVAVCMLSCVWDGCKRHLKEIPEAWQKKIEANRFARKELKQKLEAMGWKVYWIFDCVRDMRAVAQTMVRMLEEVERKKADINDAALARLARQDVISRSSDRCWREFLREIVRGGSMFIKNDIWMRLARRGDHWDPEIFDEVWKTAKHHGLITADPSRNGFYTLPLMNVVLEDAGIKGVMK